MARQRKRIQLDSKDSTLLYMLARNARISNRELSERVGLSQSACLARLRKLETEGVIVGYRAVIAPELAGRPLEGWADIRLLDATPEAMERFAVLVRETDAIVEAYQITGHNDYCLRFFSGEFDAWRVFRQKLEEMGCVTQSRFSVLLEPLK